MRIPVLYVATLLLCLAAFSAGCTGPSPAPGTAPGTAATASTTAMAAPTAPPYTELSQLALTRTDVPFTVLSEMNETITSQQSDPQTGFTVARGYRLGFSTEEKDSPTATILLQTIAEVPCGNASSSFTALEEKIRSINDPKTTVIWFPDPGVGDRSLAVTMKSESTAPVDNPFTMIFFAKSDILETIVLKTKTADIATLTGIAQKAAAKIPPSASGSVCPVITAAPTPPVQTTTEPTKIPVQPAVSALQVSGPVKVMSSDGKTVRKISFDFKAGSSPVDLSRVEFMVSTPADLRTAGPGSPAVHYTKGTSPVTQDTVLGPGDAVTVELDTGAMGFAAHPLAPGNRFTIEVRPPIGASLLITRTVPSQLTAGSSSECY
jgi:archaeal flagellin FlaB